MAKDIQNSLAKENGQDDGLVEIFLPKRHPHDDQQYVAVNGERILVQRGKLLRLPSRFAAALQESMDQQERAEAYRAKIAKE